MGPKSLGSSQMENFVGCALDYSHYHLFALAYFTALESIVSSIDFLVDN